MLTKKRKRLSLVAMALVVVFVLPNAVSAATVNVSIIDFDFVPSTITINAGDEVVWRNNGIQPHTVTHCARPAPELPCPPPLFDSGQLLTGQTFSRVFPTPGTFPYYCQIHPFMTGVVIVAADGTTTTSSTSTTLLPTTTTSTTSTTLLPTTTTSTTSTTLLPTTTTSTTSTTLLPTTTSSTTSTTLLPTTTTSTTSTTLLPTTTSSTTSTTRPPTTTTTLGTPPTGGVCGALVTARASFNAQIDRLRDTLRNAFGSALAQLFLPQLAQVRAQGNAQFDQALAACRAAFPVSDSTAAATVREATAALGS